MNNLAVLPRELIKARKTSFFPVLQTAMRIIKTLKYKDTCFYIYGHILDSINEKNIYQLEINFFNNDKFVIKNNKFLITYFLPLHISFDSIPSPVHF